MRTRITVLLAIGALALFFRPAVTAAQETPRIAVTLSSAKQVFKAGAEIRLRLVLRNDSDKPAWVPRSPDPAEAEMFYDVQVRDKDGNDAPKTEYGRKPRRSGSVYKEFLQPGQTMKEDLLLDRMFDLSAPGIYQVDVSRSEPSNPDAEPVKSNTITITVVP